MPMGLRAETADEICFGPFRLVISERLFMRDGAAQPLSGRALDLLIALVSRPSQPIDKRDLISQVWPDVTVGEGSLRFHMAYLRKILGDGKEGARYISTLAGRGYSFVGAISPPRTREYGGNTEGNPPRSNLPARLHRMVGRSDCVLALAAQVASARFVTIVGTGGVGKTTVAIAVGHDLIEEFAGAVLFVDFAALSDPNLAATALASLLGLSVRSDNAIPGITAYLRDRRLLLILDNCEHLIEASASLAEQIFLSAPHVHILATSRESLRVEGEHVSKLEPLACAPEDPGLTKAVALEFPATQLFMERAAASGARLQLTDADAAIVGHICRKLDGVALAIELAAGRVEAHGLKQTAALLDQRLALLWHGSRTAPPRQKTLQATLDWSYGLLSELERVVLRRLAVFVGYFTMHGALAIVTNETVEESLVFGAIDSLVAKSMVASRPLGAMMRYRLLETTRDYALSIEVDKAEIRGVAARHAEYSRQWLAQIGARWTTLSNTQERQYYLDGLHNVRAALEWCFGNDGDARIGLALAAAAAHVFLALSLPSECQRWSERAVLELDDGIRGGLEEMVLQAAYGMSLMFTRGMTETALKALQRSLEIAENRAEAISQIQLLGPLHMFHLRMGDYQTSLSYAKRSAIVSANVDDQAAATLSHALLGITHHLTGDLNRARLELEAAVRRGPGSARINEIYLGFDHQLWAGMALARTLWLQGHPVQAIERARRTIEEAVSLGHPVTVSIVVNWSVSLFFWAGDFQSAEEQIDRFITHAEHHSLGPYLAVGRARKGELAIRRGDPARGVEILQHCLNEFHASRYELLTTEFEMSLAQGLLAAGRFADAITVVEETILRIETSGNLAYMPEALQVKCRVLRTISEASDDDVERHLLRSLELSRCQGAGAWELRAAVDLAALWASKGQQDHAEMLLRPVFENFTNGSGMPDLMAAESLLKRLKD
jgi:predicted ATPase/DNA-binding winged helix-turn-helix (wHTH) protein